MKLTGRWLPALTTDGWLLFATYSARLVAYGFVSVVLGLYLARWASGQPRSAWSSRQRSAGAAS